MISKVPFTHKGHAKINITLDILGTRPDGFHEVRTIMQPLEMADSVTVTQGEGIELSCTDERVPLGPANSVHKAAMRLYQRAGITPQEQGARIHIDKCLPLAGGLGGSSADVGPALRGLNEALQLNYATKTLEELAGSIGADAAFSVQNNLCLSEGKGERLTMLQEMPPAGIVVVAPSIEYVGEPKTARMYSLFDSFAAQGNSPKQTTDDAAWAIRNKDWEQLSRCASNSFEPAIYPRFPQLASLASALVRAGCWTAHLAGSGPCVYGVCEEKQAKSIAKQVSVIPIIAAVHATRTLQR